MALKRPERPAERTASAASTRDGSPGRQRSIATAEITVKGVRATSRQREVIDGCLSQAERLGASRRVMVAVVMCITQESLAGKLAGITTGNDDVGIFQQGRNWVSVEGSKDPAASTRAFLTSPRQGWRAMHGGLKRAPGNLSLAIHAVQRNADPNAYAAWEGEATKTVEWWLGEGGGGDGGDTTTQRKRYEFTRGERKGEPENSWDAMGRLLGEVRAQRWAAGNVLHAASDDELIAAPASVMVRGTEDWLIQPPAYEWAAGRPVTEVTLQVLADRWGVMPGSVVVLSSELGAVAGRYLVKSVSGQRLDSPVTQVVLRRPTRIRPEPAAEEVTSHEAGDRDGTDGGAGSGSINTTGGARGIVDQAVELAKQVGGSGVYVGSALRAGDTVGSGAPSDHSQNNATRAARDIGVRGIDLLTGPPSPKLDKAVVAIGAAFGRDYGTGRSGPFQSADNINWRGFRVQVIWRTPQWGGHMGHVHVGVRRN